MQKIKKDQERKEGQFSLRQKRDGTFMWDILGHDSF